LGGKSIQRLFPVIAFVVLSSLIVAACQPRAQTVAAVVTDTPPKADGVVATPAPTARPKRPNVIRANLGPGDLPTADPGLAEDVNSVTVVEAAFVGLTRQDEETSVLQPGMATRWDISPDGRVYTFHLRDDVPWVRWNGNQVVKVQTCPDQNGRTRDRIVTARDIEYGALRALDPKTGSPYAYVLTFVVRGADEFYASKITNTEKIGVKALDDWTLQVQFKEPAAYNASIIGLWMARATPRWIIEGDDCTQARGDRWIEPGFFQSYGPLTLKEWVHDSTLTLIKNPFWPGDPFTPQAQVSEVVFSMLDEVPAMAEFEAGNLDVSEVSLADIDRVKADPKLSGLLHTAPQLCTYYYGFNTKAAIVSDARVRRALSMAVDRASLIKNVIKGEQQPAQWFSRPGLAAAPTIETHPNLGVKYDPEQAKKLMAEYLKEKNLTAAQLDMTLMFNTSSGHQKIAEAIQQMWRDTLGVNVKLTNQEWKVFLKTIRSQDTPQIWRSGWCLDYPDANNFAREVMAVGGSSNPAEQGEPLGGVNWKNGKFEDLVKLAAVEMDPARRVELYAQAEQILVHEDAVVIPLYWYASVNLTQPWVKRTFSVGGHQRYEKWKVLQDQ
jgi:oligopeptide transport system substrate-binding protein